MIASGRAYTAVNAVATVSGTIKEWAAPARRSAFCTAAEKAFKGTECILNGTKAGSVVLDFTVVQYADAAKGVLSIADQFADATIMAAFRAAVLAATGSTFEAAPTIVSVTDVDKDGKVVYSSTISGGAVAGIVLGCVIVAAMLIGCCVCSYRKRRATAADPVETYGL